MISFNEITKKTKSLYLSKTDRYFYTLFMLNLYINEKTRDNRLY